MIISSTTSLASWLSNMGAASENCTRQAEATIKHKTVILVIFAIDLEWCLFALAFNPFFPKLSLIHSTTCWVNVWGKMSCCAFFYTEKKLSSIVDEALRLRQHRVEKCPGRDVSLCWCCGRAKALFRWRHGWASRKSIFYEWISPSYVLEKEKFVSLPDNEGLRLMTLFVC